MSPHAIEAQMGPPPPPTAPAPAAAVAETEPPEDQADADPVPVDDPPEPEARVVDRERPEGPRSARRAESSRESVTGVLTPGTRGFYIRFNAGRSYMIASDDPVDYAGGLASPSFRLEQAFGLHPVTRTSEGFVLEIVAQETFNGATGDGSRLSELAIGPRFGGDLRLGAQHAVYFRPHGTVMYNLQQEILGGPDGETNRYSRVALAFGMDFSLILTDRFVFAVRPLELELATSFSSYSVRANLIGGAGITF